MDVWNKIYLLDNAQLSVDETVAKMAAVRLKKKARWRPGRKYSSTVDVYGSKVFLTIRFDEEDNLDILNARYVKKK